MKKCKNSAKKIVQKVSKHLKGDKKDFLGEIQEDKKLKKSIKTMSKKK